MSATDTIFQPLEFRNLTVPNRLICSSIGNRIDFYDGTGSEIRIRWDVKWARTGVGAMISTHSPVDVRGNLFAPFRAHRPRRPDPVLARAHQPRPRKRLPVHPAARLRRQASRGRRHPLREGHVLHRQGRLVAGLRVQEDDDRRDRERRAGVRAGGSPGPRGGRGRRRDPRGERVRDHAVPLQGDQRPHRQIRRADGESGALRPGDRAGDPAPGRRRLPRPVQDQRRRARARDLSVAERTTATRSRTRCRSASCWRTQASTPSTSPRAPTIRIRGTRPAASRSTTSRRSSTSSRAPRGLRATI